MSRRGWAINGLEIRNLAGSVAQSGTYTRLSPSGDSCKLEHGDCYQRVVAAARGAVRVRHVPQRAFLDRLRYALASDLPACGEPESTLPRRREEVWRAPAATHGDTLSTSHRVVEITGEGGFWTHGDGATGFAETAQEIAWTLTLRRR